MVPTPTYVSPQQSTVTASASSSSPTMDASTAVLPDPHNLTNLVNATQTLYQNLLETAQQFRSQSRVNRQWKNPLLFKTTLCDHWMAQGTCKYGNRCWYAHGTAELRFVPRLDRVPQTMEALKQALFVDPSNANKIYELTAQLNEINGGMQTAAVGAMAAMQQQHQLNQLHQQNYAAARGGLPMGYGGGQPVMLPAQQQPRVYGPSIYDTRPPALMDVRLAGGRKGAANQQALNYGHHQQFYHNGYPMVDKPGEKTPLATLLWGVPPSTVMHHRPESRESWTSGSVGGTGAGGSGHSLASPTPSSDEGDLTFKTANSSFSNPHMNSPTNNTNPYGWPVIGHWTAPQKADVEKKEEPQKPRQQVLNEPDQFIRNLWDEPANADGVQKWGKWSLNAMDEDSEKEHKEDSKEFDPFADSYPLKTIF